MWPQRAVFVFKVARRIAVAAALTVLLTGCPPSTTAAEPDLSEILQHLDEWRQSFASIRVISHGWNRADALESYPDLDANVEFEGLHYHRNEFLWADWGAVRYELLAFRDGAAFYRDSHASDGVQPWEADGKPGNGGQLALLKLVKPRLECPLASRMTNEATHGLYCTWNASWINARLRQAALDRFEELDGHRCAVVRLTIETTHGRPKEETYWLDPEHGYLPRKVLEMGPARGKPGLIHYFTWAVDRFQKLGEGIWFPEHGNLVDVSSKPPGFEWIIKEVILNESLARTEFGPPDIAGLPVVDYVNGKTYRIGKEERPPTNAAPAAENDSASGDTSAGSPVLAIPQAFPWHWVGLIGGVVVAGGIALRWLQRLR